MLSRKKKPSLLLGFKIPRLCGQAHVQNKSSYNFLEYTSLSRQVLKVLEISV